MHSGPLVRSDSPRKFCLHSTVAIHDGQSPDLISIAPKDQGGCEPWKEGLVKPSVALAGRRFAAAPCSNFIEQGAQSLVGRGLQFGDQLRLSGGHLFPQGKQLFLTQECFRSWKHVLLFFVGMMRH